MSTPRSRELGPRELRVRDAVVVGGGVAGLSAALGLAREGRRVALLTKVPACATGAGGSSVWAQGGVAAALGDEDSPALHARDTLAAAAGLALPEAVEVLTTEGPQRVLELIGRGAGFDRDARGQLALGREAAHGRRRILHARGDATGAEVVRALWTAVLAAPGVEIHDRAEALQLEVHEGRVVGVVVSEARTVSSSEARSAESPVLYRAPAVVLATGGLGQLYRFTTNPPECGGDGIALAAGAGARLADLEMVQFHPTALAVESGGGPLPLATEALRGEGAILVDGQGRRFMVDEHPDAELAPRDIVARAIFRLREAGDEVFLDTRDAVGQSFPERFPTVFALAQRYGLDPRVEPLPVTPAAHFHMGGIAVDLSGRSSLPGLWACGEVACTGVHGANRLASNSLLEGLVFGARVAADINATAGSAAPSTIQLGGLPILGFPLAAAGSLEAEEQASLLRQMRRWMWRDVGVERSASGLARARGKLESLGWRLEALDPALRRRYWVARLVTQAASLREESRGGHWRTDFPRPRVAWRHRLFLHLQGRRVAIAEPWPNRWAAQLPMEEPALELTMQPAIQAAVEAAVRAGNQLASGTSSEPGRKSVEGHS
ncbi:MAG: L-aspartate oxidase [Acidobacteriota bacterium]